MTSRPPAALALATLVVAAALPAARAQNAGSSASAAPADTAASPDSAAAAARPLISTDGAVSVHEESRPGEGIEGFWWEYDPTADLERFLDEERRRERLEPVRDPFGFELQIPDTIRALRDSVRAVADSILADRIDLSAVFDPKLTTTYGERKDEYELRNEFTTNYPVTRRGKLTLVVDDSNKFHRTVRRVQDNRRVTSTFNYSFAEETVSSLSLNWTDGVVQRDGEISSTTEAVSLTGRLQGKRPAGPLGEVDVETGLNYTQRDYRTTATDGKSGEVRPDWKVRLSRSYGGGGATLGYEGAYGKSAREETTTLTVLDTLGVPQDSTAINESDDTSVTNKLSLSADYDFTQETELTLRGSLSSDQLQFLSQDPEFIGKQETRVNDSEDLSLDFRTKPIAELQVRARALYRANETSYEQEADRTRRNATRSGNVDVTYEAWEGGRWIFKMEVSRERRDRRTLEAGDVIQREASADFRQEITERIDFEAAYLVSLDRFEFDAAEENGGDRDLRRQRGTFTVRYNPVDPLTSALRMEVQSNETVNILPPRSGDNNVDHGFLIRPDYTWKVGRANFRGEFTANALYKVQDFDEEDNTLVRRFSYRQSWQQAFTGRLSTETQYRWEFSDQGSYNRSRTDGRRRYGRSGETRRATMELKVLYTLLEGVRANVAYRRDEDQRYRFPAGERTLQSELPRREFTYGVTVKRALLRKARLDVTFRQTFNDGPGVSRLESNFYTVQAAITYQPLKKAPQ